MSDISHLRLRVVPNASASRIEKSKDSNSYIVYVRASAEEGKANKEAVEVVRKELGINGQIRIVSGHRKPNKIIAFND